MAESTLEAPTIPEPTTADQTVAGEPAPWTLRAYTSEHPWLSVSAVILVFSALLTVWARTRPSYDAYGWMVWGHQTWRLTLDLGGAPSWKPVPFLFTVPYALAGHYQLWLWMITATAVALGGTVFAARIAYRLVGGNELRLDPDPIRRYAPWVAAFIAGAGVLGIEDYFHYILSSQSDPMIVTFLLAAIDMVLIGRYRWTLVFGVLAALGRPEVWPFLGLFGLWAWFKIPSMRWMLILGAAVVLFMWFGVPTITNGRPDIAGQLAQGSPRELHSNRLVGTLGRVHEILYLPVWIAAGIAAALALLRRNWVVVALAVLVVVWAIVEIAFAYHGWPALPRYVFEAGGVVSVLAGVAVGWLMLEGTRIGPNVGIPRWSGVVVAAALVATMIPGAIHRVRTERTDLTAQHARTHEISLLQSATNALGGAHHILDCGQPVTDVEFASTVAWIYNIDVGSVGGFQQHVEAAELANPAIPKVLIHPLAGGGWQFQPWHTRTGQVARCAGIHAIYTGSGALIHQ